jgi:hypothetical protein
MPSLYRNITGLAATALLIAACSRDSQTDRAVETDGPGMAASTSASGDSADKSGMAMVRVVNAAAASSELVVRTDETRAMAAVEYKQVTPYQMIDKNWVTFQVRGTPAGSYEQLETNRELLTDGHRYSLIVMRDDEGNAYRTRVVRDDIFSDTSTAHVRVIHAAVNAGEVNVLAGAGNKLFDGVNFTSEAGFKDVQPWSGILEFRSEDGNRLLLASPKVDFQRGKSYTIVLTRGKNGKLETFWFEDSQL